MMTLDIRMFDSRTEQAGTLARDVATNISVAIRARHRAGLAVPGGSTPGAFLCELAQQPLDWSSVTFTLTDERWVPASHERSNEGALRRALAAGAANAATVFSLFDGDGTPEQAVSTITKQLEHVLPLDVCIVGMGGDGHFASLFPGMAGLAEMLNENGPESVVAARPEGDLEARLSLTLSTIIDATNRYILICGEEKLTVLQAAYDSNDPLRFPIAALVNGSRPPTVYYAP